MATYQSQKWINVIHPVKTQYSIALNLPVTDRIAMYDPETE